MVDTSKTQSGPTHIVESHHAVEIRITQAIKSSKHGVNYQISLLQQGNFCYQHSAFALDGMADYRRLK